MGISTSVRKGLRLFSLIIAIIFCLYFGIGGYLATVELSGAEKAKFESAPENKHSFLLPPDYTTEITVRNDQEEEYRRTQIYLSRIFPYLNSLSLRLGLVITATLFGALGGVTKLFKDHFFGIQSLYERNNLIVIILGGLCGLFVLGMSYILPGLLVSGEQSIKPETIMFLSLFAGLFCEKFYAWLEKSFDKILPLSKKTDPNEK